MKTLRAMFVRFAGLFRRKRNESEMNEELRAHLEALVERNIAAGMPPDEARYAALRTFGGVAQIAERARDERRSLWLEQALQDLRYAGRQARKQPGLTGAIVLILGLGIGACSAMFSVVHSVLLRPLDFPESERLVVLEEFSPGSLTTAVAPANFRDWAALGADVFEHLYAQRNTTYTLTGEGDPARVRAIRVSGRYFGTLGIPPALGRAFGPADDEPGKGNVVVLTHDFWQRQFAGRPDAIGKEIRLNDQLHTVIGVLPANFPRGFARDLVAPLGLTEAQWQSRADHYLTAIARLKKGVTFEQARTRLATIAAGLAPLQYPKGPKDWRIELHSLLESRTGDVRDTLHVLLATVAVLLLIACANVANLLLARASARRREMAVRATLGGSRGRIARQLLLESLVLALGGGGLGVIVGAWGLKALEALAPANLPRLAEISLDGRALAVTLGLSLVTGIVFGLVPAWQGSHVDPVEGLKDGGRGATGGRRGRFIRDSLVVVEIALALVLLTSAGLLIRSFSRLTAFDPGFVARGALRVVVELPGERYNTDEKRNAFVDALLERYRALPGVTAVGVVQVMPMAGVDVVLGLQVEGRETSPGGSGIINYFAVTPDYFTAAGIPLVRGRSFTARDRVGTTPVMIISPSAAEKYFPGVDPIGQRISVSDGPQRWREIVGVVGDVKLYGFERDTAPQAYAAYAQRPVGDLNFIIRVGADVAALAPALRREVHAIDPGQPVSSIAPLERLLETAFARRRFAMILVGVFSGLALVLAVAGIYSVIAYAASQRTGEFGIRIALGAQRHDIFALVFRHGGRLIALGVTGGALAAFAIARFLESVLYQTSARDPFIFTVIGALMVVIAFLACWLPALRAAKVDPIVALRAE